MYGMYSIDIKFSKKRIFLFPLILLFSIFRLLLLSIGMIRKEVEYYLIELKFDFSYIAVTKPLKYARHKNPKRVAIMIVIVWLISFLIALPIVR